MIYHFQRRKHLLCVRVGWQPQICLAPLIFSNVCRLCKQTQKVVLYKVFVFWMETLVLFMMMSSMRGLQQKAVNLRRICYRRIMTHAFVFNGKEDLQNVNVCQEALLHP